MKKQDERQGTKIFSASRRGFSALALSGMASLMLAGRGAAAGAVSSTAWEEIEARARKEGSLMIYGTLVSPVADRLRADFTQM